MRSLTFAGLLLLVGCGDLSGVLDSVTLTEAEMQDVADNYGGAIVAFKELEYFATRVAAGEVDLTGAQFTAPTAENGWVGRIQFVSDQFPGGAGDLDLTFSVTGPDGPVDPFTVDTETAVDLTTAIVIQFTGVTSEGATLALDADFTLRMDRTNPDLPVTTVNGDFRIQHNDYVADLTAENLAFVENAADGTLSSGSGVVYGQMEIPGYAFDADIDVVVDGDQVHLKVTVLDETVEDAVVSLQDYFGSAPAATP